jgi:hypothetical protein
MVALLASRFWQRGAETILAEDFPIPAPQPATPPSDQPHFSSDPQPDPEPAAPSLPEPDPGVFHHDVPPAE